MTDSRRLLPVVSQPTTDDAPADQGGLTRRSALQGLVAGLGGLAVASPADAHDAHAVAAHAAQRQKPRPGTTKPALKAPRFFDAHQFATLSVIADLIVPGAVASGSPAWIDEVMAVEHDDVQRTLVNALAAVDAAAREQHGAPFRGLTAAQQPVLLESLARPLATLKTWVAGAHFSSEAGMKELGYSGSVFFQTFPACTHPEGHA